MGDAFTDLPIGQVQVHPMIRTGAEGDRAILEAHIRGDAAPALDAMAEDDRLRFVLAEMQKVHPGVDAHYEGGDRRVGRMTPGRVEHSRRSVRAR